MKTGVTGFPKIETRMIADRPDLGISSRLQAITSEVQDRPFRDWEAGRTHWSFTVLEIDCHWIDLTGTRREASGLVFRLTTLL